MFGRPGDEALRIEPLEVLVVGGRFGQSFPPDEITVESVGDDLPYGIEQRDGSPVGVDQKIACAKILSGAAPDPSDPSDELPVRGEQQERGVASVEYEQGVPAGFQQFGVGQQARFGGLQRRDLHAPEPGRRDAPASPAGEREAAGSPSSRRPVQESRSPAHRPPRRSCLSLCSSYFACLFRTKITHILENKYITTDYFIEKR